MNCKSSKKKGGKIKYVKPSIPARRALRGGVFDCSLEAPPGDGPTFQILVCWVILLIKSF